jgi:hypothetical protein
MSTQPFDYSAIVADLEAKKAAIEATLTSLRSAMALGALGQPGDSPAIPGVGSSVPMYGGDIPDGAFLNKGIPEATKLYLEMVKKKQTSSEIAAALRKGGMESTSSDFVGVVNAGLNRARKLPASPLLKLGSFWGLKTWYPKGIVSGIGTPAKKAKKKSRKPAKAAESKPKETATVQRPEPVKPGVVLTMSGAKDKILEMLTMNPHLEFTAKDLAAQFGQEPQKVYLILGNLGRARKIEKTASGAYRAPRGPAENATAAS